MRCELGLVRGLDRRATRRLVVLEAPDLGAMRLLGLAQACLELGARPLHLALGARVLLRHALADRLDLVARLVDLAVRVVEPRLQALLALGRLVALAQQLGDLLRRRHHAALEAERLLLEIAARSIELADLVLVIEDLPLLGVQILAQVEDVLFLLVDDLAQREELALLGERRRLVEALARLLELLAQRLALVLQRADARLELHVARLGLAQRAVVDDHHRRGRRGFVQRLVDVLDVLGRRRHVQHVVAVGRGRDHRQLGRGDRVVVFLVGRLDAVVGQRARPKHLVIGGRRHRLGRRLPPEGRRQVLVTPQRPQVDHVAAVGGLGHPLVGAGLERGEGGLGLRVEGLTLER